MKTLVKPDMGQVLTLVKDWTVHEKRCLIDALAHQVSEQLHEPPTGEEARERNEGLRASFGSWKGETAEELIDIINRVRNIPRLED